MIPIQLYIQPLFLHTVFLSIFKSTNSCFRCLDIYVCTWRTHINTTHSVIHLAIQLSYLLVLLGLFFTSLMWNCNFYTEQFRYSTDDISVYLCKSSACTLLRILWCLCYFLFCHLLLSKAAYVYDCVHRSNTCLSPFTKGMVNYFLKTLPVPKNNLTAAPWLFSSMQPLGMQASCATCLTAHEGKCHNLG